MKNNRWAIVTILSLLTIILITIQPASGQLSERTLFSRVTSPERPPWGRLSQSLILAKTVFSSVNTVLLAILLAIYIGIYRKTTSQFSIGLIIVTTALLLYALTSNPLIHRLIGFRLSGLGPFTMLPDLFTCIAAAILLYLSSQ